MCVLQGIYKKNVLEDDLPYLEFGGTVMYSQEKNDCSFLSEDLRYVFNDTAVETFGGALPVNVDAQSFFQNIIQ